MPNLAKTLKEEIARVSRREIRSEIGSMRKASAQHRRDIAALKRQIDKQKRKIEFLEKQETRRVKDPEVPTDKVYNARFSARGLSAHRAKLKLSAANYAKLVGVSPLSVYNWEHGKSRPRKAQLASLLAVRQLGVREAKQRLNLLRNGQKKK